MRCNVKAGLAAGLVLALSACGNPASSPSATGTETDSGPASAPASGPASATPASAAPASSLANVAAQPAAFSQCVACHSIVPGQNMVGPSLFGVYGRKSASMPNYAYSDALKNLHLTWNDKTLDKWLAGPMTMAPGTRMSFGGFTEPAKRKAVIAYLKTLK